MESKNTKTGIIDVGSNSVRLAMLADGKTLYKTLQTTRLGEGLSLTGQISQAAIHRTAVAVNSFALQARREGAENIYVFATAAVRSAQNGGEFVKYVSQNYGLTVDVVSGETEAKLGLLGALENNDGGIVDLGGASCEVTVSDKGNTIYTKSVDVGAVRLLDICGRDRSRLESFISQKLPEYGDFTAKEYNMYAISGTATTLGAVKHGLKEYNPAIVHGTVLTADEVGDYADKFLSMAVEEIKKVAGMAVWRADVIGGATLFLYRLMQRMQIDKMTVSENDNLEGYAIYKGIKK